MTLIPRNFRLPPLDPDRYSDTAATTITEPEPTPMPTEPTAWDKLTRQGGPRPERDELPDDTPFTVEYRDISYPYRVTSVMEDEEYLPELDIVVPTVELDGKLPRGQLMERLTGAVLIRHASSIKELPLKITSFYQQDSVVSLGLKGYGSAILLGPLVDWVPLPEPTRVQLPSKPDDEQSVL
jgi:hypothetical protein